MQVFDNVNKIVKDDLEITIDRGSKLSVAAACFSDTISDKVVKEIAKRQPLRAVFRDSSFSSSPEKINVEEIFKLLAPNTTVKVI